MTTMTQEAVSGKAHGPMFGRLLLAEWTKLRSVRSTYWSLILLVLITFGFTALFVGLTVSQWDKSAKDNPDQMAQLVRDPAGFIFGAGIGFGQLTICVLGVLVITSEYSTGMIRSSLLAVPTRLPMLAAKCAVFAAVVFVIAELIAFPTFFLGSAMLHSKVQVSLSDPGVLRACLGVGLYLAMVGLFALAIGGIVRHTAGSITGVIAFVLVIAPLAQLLPGKTGKYVHAYLPTEAGSLIGKAVQGKDDVLTPWQGYGVFALWTVVLLAVAAYLLRRRDA